MKMKKRIIKICVWGAGGFAVVCLALMLICNQIVVNNAGTAGTGNVSPNTEKRVNNW